MGSDILVLIKRPISSVSHTGRQRPSEVCVGCVVKEEEALGPLLTSKQSVSAQAIINIKGKHNSEHNL